MIRTKHCKECGAELGNGAPVGLCPQCLGKATTGHAPAPPVIGGRSANDSESGKETAQGGTGVVGSAQQVSPDRPVDRAAKGSKRKLVLAGLLTAVVAVLALGLVGWRLARAARQDRARLSAQAKAARDAIAVQLAAHGIAARDPKARPSLVDLSLHYNLGLTQPRDSFDPENSLAPFAAGTPMLGGVELDLRGTARLGGSNPWVSGCPFHGHEF